MIMNFIDINRISRPARDPIELVRQCLDKLGKMTPLDIAHLFSYSGIHGERCDPDQCPVGNFILRSTGFAVQVGANNTTVAGKTIKNPYSVKGFVTSFDAGMLVIL